MLESPTFIEHLLCDRDVPCNSQIVHCPFEVSYTSQEGIGVSSVFSDEKTDAQRDEGTHR